MTLDEQIKAKSMEVESLRAELSRIESNEELTFTDESDKDAYEEDMLRAGAESYMEYDPDTAYKWLLQAENLRDKRESRKSAGKVTSTLLKAVATSFQDVRKQPDWDKLRAEWLSKYPSLESFIPVESSQGSWEVLQAQGGFEERARAKGPVQKASELRRLASTKTFLSSQQSNQGNTQLATQLSNEAAELVRQADELEKKAMPVVEPTKAEILGEFSEDISSLLSKTSAFKTPLDGYNALETKVTGKYGEGANVRAALDQVKAQLGLSAGEKTEAYRQYDVEASKDANTAETLANLATAVYSRIQAVRDELKNLGAGALTTLGKTIQEDVLANEEFRRWQQAGGPRTVFADAFEKLKESLLNVTATTDPQTTVNIFNAVVAKYTAMREAYNTAIDVKRNKYARPLPVVEPMTMDEFYSATQATPGGGGETGVYRDLSGQTVKVGDTVMYGGKTYRLVSVRNNAPQWAVVK